MASQGNTKLRAARRSLGLRSQSALADAINQKATELGLRVDVTDRTVRRWESARPGWPHPDSAHLLEQIFQKKITELGFTPSWKDDADAQGRDETSAHHAPITHRSPRAVGTPPSDALLPVSTGYDYIATTAVYRRHYWALPAGALYRVVVEHVHLGTGLINQFDDPLLRARVCSAISESSMLAGRLAFFDLRTPDPAREHFTQALQAAYEAEDDVIGAAVLAHLAFAPAFSGDPTRSEEARDHIRAAYTFARRGSAPPGVMAWLHAVDAEVETRFGDTRRALTLIHNAEQLLEQVDEQPDPAWFDWFSAARLAGFKGNTLLAAGQGREADAVLSAALNELPAGAAKQRAVLLADLAAAAVLRKEPEQACVHLHAALDQLGRTWYATAMDRIKAVRQSLREWDSLPVLRALDDKLYDWSATVNSIMR